MELGGEVHDRQPVKYKSVFVSDIHLGTKMSQADRFLDFMKTFECDNLYLVGDIVDGWAMNSKMYWSQSHNDVVQKLLRKARKGVNVVFIPGNHDEFLKPFCGNDFGNIKLMSSDVYSALNGKRYSVVHGDQFDVVINHAKWLSHLGSWAYDVSIVLNVVFNKFMDLLDMPRWSVSAWLKYKVKSAVNFIGAYEETLSAYAKKCGSDGIICGHIHHANIATFNDVEYMNCGDWVESCTALVEKLDGTWEIIRHEDYARN